MENPIEQVATLEVLESLKDVFDLGNGRDKNQQFHR